ncbi:hypothetical protein BDQ17DRAFT_1434581 [Cyathus striatus]|nr:hypothetical protein BDQ17DRAFT_1434581 [Cyathus striatus]
MSSATLHIIHKYVEKLSRLIPLLLGSVPYAEKDGMIQKVFKSIPVLSSLESSKDSELHWQVFNQRMDILFGENMRNHDGGLFYLQCNPFGIDAVLEYVCTAVETGKLPLNIAAIKVKWLVDGVEEVTYE